MNRIKTIKDLIPKDVKTVLDIGSQGNIFNKKYKTTTIDNIEEADIKQDLNINQKLNFPDNSFDIVILNQVLEHLTYVEEIIEEAKRVSKIYFFVGFPNELLLRIRVRYLFGRLERPGYSPYGHKHSYGIKEANEFIKKFFGKYQKRIYFNKFIRLKFLHEDIVRFLANLKPSLFAKEVFYLIKLEKGSRNSSQR